MLTVLFFISVFSSITWVVYVVLYLIANLSGNDFSSLPVTQLALYIGLIVAPVWAVWQIFGLISGYKNSSNIHTKLVQLFNQMKKNQDYTDLIVRVMLDAEHEIKDGFVINKFDVFVADMNEILADIVQRCNAASSLQMEQLWSKVKNGERWAIAKTLVETSKSHADFSTYLAQKAQKDDVFKGTLLEFCYRYQNLSALLEKHDRDRVFITILETGVMGKAYSILAPVADLAGFSVDPQPEIESQYEEKPDISPRILQMQEPDQPQKQNSFWKKMSLFKKTKHEEDVVDKQDSDDEFFNALQRSMNSPEETHQDFVNGTDESLENDDFPRFGLSAENKQDDDFMPRFDINMPQEKTEPFVELEPLVEMNKVEVKKEPDLTTENNFAYPFGGWINEDNYKK